MDDLRFDGRTAVVTGAGRGVGRAHALLLASRGARVVVADLGGGVDGAGSSSEPADAVVEQIRVAGGEAVACYASVADEAGAQAIVDKALSVFGRLDVVVNNAGISNPGPFEDLPGAQFRQMVEVHYLGTVYVTQAAWPHLRAAGYGRVVNTCSEAMLGIHGNVVSYAGAKGGVFGFTRGLAAEAAGLGILVNAVAPRAATRMSDSRTLSQVFGVPEESFAGVMEMMPPELVAPAAAYLAHESCRLSGEVLVAGAGAVQRLAVVASKGIYQQSLTPEDVAGGIDAITDLAGAEPVAVGAATDLVQA